jgi:hypothetical protein
LGISFFQALPAAFSTSVEAQNAPALSEDLPQILTDLSLDNAIRIEEARVYPLGSGYLRSR